MTQDLDILALALYVCADQELVAPTRRVFVDTTDPASVASATAWWEELTSAGGEGMVVDRPGTWCAAGAGSSNQD